jgi:hypothetical protein
MSAADESPPGNGVGAADKTTPTDKQELSDSRRTTTESALADKELSRFALGAWEKMCRGYFDWFNSAQRPIAEATIARWSQDYLRQREGQFK